MADVRLGGDIVHSSNRYVLARDEETGLLHWTEGDWRSNQEGEIGYPVAATWLHGSPGGMGETKRISDDSFGYAFTNGMDATSFGKIRLAGRRVSSSPSNAPVDAPTYGFEETPSSTQALGDFAISSFHFTKSATSTTVPATPPVLDKDGNIISPGTPAGTQVVPQAVLHNLGRTPKVILIWTSGGLGSGTVRTDGIRFMRGVWASTGEEFSFAGSSIDGQDGNKASYSSFAESIVHLLSPGALTGTVRVRASIASVGPESFTLQYTLNDDTEGVIFHGIAIAGDDVEIAIKQWTVPTGGTTRVVNVGFTPSCVLHLYAGVTGASGPHLGFAAGVGFMTASAQWASAVKSIPLGATSDTKRAQTTGAAVYGYGDGTSTGIDFSLSLNSFTSSGFVMDVNTPASQEWLVVSVAMGGNFNVAAGEFTKVQSPTTAQIAINPGFTSTGFLLSSIGHTSDTATDGLNLSFGAATSTSQVESSAINDRDNQATSAVAGLDDYGKAFSLIGESTETVTASASCGSTNINTSGWLNWGANDSEATLICYAAFGPVNAATVDNTRMIYIAAGRYLYKYSVSGTTITNQTEKDFGASASCGRPEKFGTGAPTQPIWWMPLGEELPYQKLVTVSIAGGGADTWVAHQSGARALHFAKTIQGASAVLVRAYEKHMVDLGTGETWTMSPFEVGDASTRITGIIDSQVSLFVAKEDNLYLFDTSGGALQITRYQTGDASTTYGSGLMAPSFAESCYYNHGANLVYFDGQRARPVGPDASPLWVEIPYGLGAAEQPILGSHLETLYASDEWVYSAYKVSRNSATYTFILAGYRNEGRITWHTYDRIDGSAHLAIIDSNKRLWVSDVTGAKHFFYQLGQSGQPDPGPDKIGFGQASTTYEWFGPSTDFGYPHTLKQLRAVEIKAQGIDNTCPVQIKCLRDSVNTQENVGGTITSGGISTRYWTTGDNDTAYDVRPIINITTTGAYAPASSDPQILSIIVRASLRPAKYRMIEFELDTERPYSNGVPQAIPPIQIRSNLVALAGMAPTAWTNPAGETVMLQIQNVDVRPKVHNPIHYVITVKAAEWVNA